MDKKDRLIELMEEMIKLQKIIARPIIKTIIEEALDKPEKMWVYELTNGKVPRGEIMEKTGASAGAISGWWNNWFSKGILEKDGSRYKRIFSLEDIGIPLPKLKNKQKPTGTGNEVLERDIAPEETTETKEIIHEEPNNSQENTGEPNDE